MHRNASRSSDRDPTGDVSYAFYNVNREDQIRSVHSKIGGLKLNRNGSPLRMYLDRWSSCNAPIGRLRPFFL